VAELWPLSTWWRPARSDSLVIGLGVLGVAKAPPANAGATRLGVATSAQPHANHVTPFLQADK
jgi:hypothetical protein